MKRPCDNCPFLRSKVEAFSLPRARKREIANSLRKGCMFPCHKTVNYDNDDEGRVTSKSRFCAGALLTMNNEDPEQGCMSNQMARIEARLGMFNPDELQGAELVFGSLKEWEKADGSR